MLTLLAVAAITVSTFCRADDNSTKTASRKDRVLVEAAIRLAAIDPTAIDLTKNVRLAGAVQRYLLSLNGDPKQLAIIKQLGLKHMSGLLLDLASQSGPTTQAVQAIDMAIEQGSAPEISKRLVADSAGADAINLAKVIALSDRVEAYKILLTILSSESSISQIKIDAALGLARNVEGQRQLIELAKNHKLPGDARAVVGSSLRASTDAAIQSAAKELFPQMKSLQASLPPITDLSKRSGDVNQGKILFNGVATCGQCHQVGSEGKNVGPALTEIGNKLSKEAMYVSILDPSAGISHNYEAYTAILDNDTVVSGLLVSQTDSIVILKDAKGIERTLARKEIEELKKQDKSLMPENLQETINEQGLVDLVEYLMSLKKA